MKPKHLEEAFEAIPPTYEASLQRNGTGYYFYLSRVMGGGKLKIISKTMPTWQEAFADVWGKL